MKETEGKVATAKRRMKMFINLVELIDQQFGVLKDKGTALTDVDLKIVQSAIISQVKCLERDMLLCGRLPENE